MKTGCGCVGRSRPVFPLFDFLGFFDQAATAVARFVPPCPGLSGTNSGTNLWGMRHELPAAGERALMGA